jgi:hypothetical protein
MNNGIKAALYMVAVPTVMFSMAAIVREFPMFSFATVLSIAAGATIYNVWKLIKAGLDEEDEQRKY